MAVVGFEITVQEEASMGTTAAAVEVPFLDVTDPAFSFDSPAVAEARETSWYATTPLGLLVLRYAEIEDLLHDSRFGQSGERFLALQGVSGGPLYEWFVRIILHESGESHRRLRRLVSKAFTPRVIEGFRPVMKRIATDLAESIAAAGSEHEFMDSFADPMPVRVICALLGVPAEDYELFRRWSTDLALVYSFALQQVRTRAEQAVIGLYGYVDALITRRRGDPRDDLLSALIAAEEAGDRLTTDELRNLLVLLVFAAHDTTRNQLGHAMVTFSEHPEQWRLLGQRPELAAQAVEEVMRWRSSVPTTFRFALQDVDVHGVHIPAGTFVALCSQAAGRDPRVFKDGDRFDITIAREAQHLAFGGGPHYCLGAATARAELAEALVALTRQFGPPMLAGPVTWRAAAALDGPDRLPLRFQPRGERLNGAGRVGQGSEMTLLRHA